MIEIFNDQQMSAFPSSSPAISFDSSNEMTPALETLDSFKRNMYSQFFSETFLGMLRSELRCTVCTKKSVSFETFSTLSLPIPEVLKSRKKDIFHLPIFFAPFDPKLKLKSSMLSLPQSSSLTVSQLIDKIVIQELKQDKSIQKHLVLAIVSSEQIKECLFEINSKRLAIDILRDCNSSSNTKFAVIYELNRPIDSYDLNTCKIFSINFKYQSGSASNGQRQVKSTIPRPLVIDTSEVLPNVYSGIEEMMVREQNKMAEIIARAGEDTSSEEHAENSSNSCLEQVRKCLQGKVFVNSEKQRRRKLPDICIFCQQTTCQSCELPFDFEKTFETFVESYKHDLSFTMFLDSDHSMLSEQLGETSSSFATASTLLKRQDPVNATIQDCFSLNASVETLDEENKYACDVCGKKQIAEKAVEVFFGPEYLVIQLKRFKVSQKGQAKVKNNETVNYQEIEDLSKFVQFKTPTGENEVTKSKMVYELYGVVLHSGSLDQGHYTAYTKQDGIWTYYDDENIKEVKAEEVISHQNAYILFYKYLEK